MDAASNNSVDDIRAIRDEVNFLPTLAKYRVYIIDEVHMLSTGAFNALLKTLEEPPSHVKFILATTEPQKLPATILSRCQRFDFKKISNSDINKRLQYVCDESKIEITKEALNIISILAEGAMRDALSILERCLQEGNEKINEDLVKDLAGIPKLAFIVKIVEAIVESDIQKTITTVDEVIQEGKDLNNLLWELIKYIKDILVWKTTQNLEIYNQEEIKQIERLSEKVSKERLLQMIYMLSELENDMKWSSQKAVLFEVAMIKLCQPTIETNRNASTVNSEGIEDLKTRITNLERKIAQGNLGSNNVLEKTKVDVNNKEKIAKSEPIDFSKLNISQLEFWPKIIEQLKTDRKMLLATNLMGTIATLVNDMTVGIVFQNGLTPFVKGIMERPENIQEIERLVSIECGKIMRIKLLDNQDAILKQKAKEAEKKNQIKDLGIPVNEIEE